MIEKNIYYYLLLFIYLISSTFRFIMGLGLISVGESYF